MAKLVNTNRSSKGPKWVQLEGKKICHFLLRLSIIVQQLQALNNERFEIETKVSVISLLVAPKTYVKSKGLTFSDIGGSNHDDDVT